MVEITQETFDKWYGTATNAKLVKNNSESLLEDKDPNHVAAARANLKNLQILEV